MLYSASELRGYTLEASDTTLGQCSDFLFDDQHWTIRYMVADTRRWLPGRKVLVSPIAMSSPKSNVKTLPVSLTKQQVQDSPPLEEHAPVSRQFEREFTRYYNYGWYWTGPGLWGATPYPGPLLRPPEVTAAPGHNPDAANEDRNLRSVNEVTGYYIQAVDGDLGHVEDFLIDGHTWTIRYLVVDTRNWLPGKKVSIPTQWVEKVDWADRAARVIASKSVIRAAPEYEKEQVLDRAYEETLVSFSRSIEGRQPVSQGHGGQPSKDAVDDVLKQSFPASDPPPY